MKTMIIQQYTMIIISILFLFYSSCEKENNGMNKKELVGTWFSPTSDTVIIDNDYKGTIKYYISDTILSSCKIDNNAFFVEINGKWESFKYIYNTEQNLIIIYDFLNIDSVYYVKRPEWLNNLIAEIHDDSLKLEGHIVYRYEWRNNLVYHIYYTLASCMYCETYYEDGSKIDWSKEDSSDFEKNKKNEIVIWRNIHELTW